MSGIDKEKLIIFRKIMNVDYEIRFINCSCSYYIVPYSYLRAGLGFGAPEPWFLSGLTRRGTDFPIHFVQIRPRNPK